MSESNGQTGRLLLDRLTNEFVRRLRLNITDVVYVEIVRDNRVERQVSFWQVLLYLGPVLAYLRSRHELVFHAKRRGYGLAKYRIAHAVAVRARELYGPKYAIPIGGNLRNLRYLGVFDEHANGSTTMLDVYMDPALKGLCILAIGADQSSHIQLGEDTDLASRARERYFRQLADLQPILANGRPREVEYHLPAEWAKKFGHSAPNPQGWGDDSQMGWESMDVVVSSREYLFRGGYLTHA